MEFGKNETIYKTLSGTFHAHIVLTNVIQMHTVTVTEVKMQKS